MASLNSCFKWVFGRRVRYILLIPLALLVVPLALPKNGAESYPVKYVLVDQSFLESIPTFLTRAMSTPVSSRSSRAAQQ